MSIDSSSCSSGASSAAALARGTMARTDTTDALADVVKVIAAVGARAGAEIWRPTFAAAGKIVDGGAGVETVDGDDGASDDGFTVFSKGDEGGDNAPAEIPSSVVIFGCTASGRASPPALAVRSSAFRSGLFAAVSAGAAT